MISVLPMGARISVTVFYDGPIRNASVGTEADATILQAQADTQMARSRIYRSAYAHHSMIVYSNSVDLS